MTADTTTLYVLYNDEPMPDFDCPLPILQHRAAEGLDPAVAVYSEDEKETAEEQLELQRADAGDHIQLAEIQVTDWNVGVGDDSDEDTDDEAVAPTTIREWNDGKPQLSKDELLRILEEEDKAISANATLMYSHDHGDKAWDLVNEGRLAFDSDRWAFRYPAESEEGGYT